MNDRYPPARRFTLVPTNGRLRLGFRMPAQRERSTAFHPTEPIPTHIANGECGAKSCENA
jgi:hypothetical protein